jgi:hypothetical protein
MVPTWSGYRDSQKVTVTLCTYNPPKRVIGHRPSIIHLPVVFANEVLPASVSLVTASWTAVELGLLGSHKGPYTGLPAMECPVLPVTSFSPGTHGDPQEPWRPPFHPTFTSGPEPHSHVGGGHPLEGPSPQQGLCAGDLLSEVCGK